jgi:hypothetical protein
LSYNIILAFILQLIILRRTLLLLYLCGSRDNDLFADSSGLVHMPVYSIDRKKPGYLRAIYSDYMIIMRGVIKLIKYFIPKSAAKSITKDSIKLRIMAYEANSNILI